MRKADEAAPRGEGSESPDDGDPTGATEHATLSEICESAEARLDARVWNFLQGGSGEESTLRANRAAFGKWELRPRALSGSPPPCTDASFMGFALSLPVMTAPFGADRLFHADGQKAVAQANARFGTGSIVPGASSFPLEEIKRAAPDATPLFQLHPVGPVDEFVALGRRAKAAGYAALCVAVDCPTRGWRERTKRDRFNPEELDAMAGNYAPGATGVLRQLSDASEPVWSWEMLHDACARVGMPFMLKGILTREDARRAIDIGAGAVLVSNHGGRQLDGVPAALDQLPEVVDEVGSETAIALDSGIRRGSDLLKALALGAEVVVIGRLAAMGLAAGGREGVLRVLELLAEELTTCMLLAGRGSIGEIDRTLLQAKRPD